MPMNDPRTEQTFGLYLMQDEEAMWCWCFGTQPAGEVFRVQVGEDRFATADQAWAAGLLRFG